MNLRGGTPGRASGNRLQRQITATDSADVAKATLAKSAQAIDKLVYELYGLTDKEIAVVAAAPEQE